MPAAFGAGSGSHMPHFGVKHLFDISGNNEKIDEDDEDAIFEALDR